MVTFKMHSFLLLLLLHLQKAAESNPFTGSEYCTKSKKRTGTDYSVSSRRTFTEDHDTTWLYGLEPESRDKTNIPDNYHEKAYNYQILDSLQAHPLLQVPCSLTLKSDALMNSQHNVMIPPTNSAHPIRCFCDTGAQKTVMSAKSAKAAGLLGHLDRRYADSQAVGVGGATCSVLGRVPPGIATFQLYNEVSVPSPAIIVLEDLCGVDLLLGLDFLRDHDAVLDLRHEELSISVQGRTVRIPFLKPRSSTSLRLNERHSQDRIARHCAKEDLENAAVDNSDSSEYEEEEVGDLVFRGQVDMSGV